MGVDTQRQADLAPRLHAAQRQLSAEPDAGRAALLTLAREVAGAAAALTPPTAGVVSSDNLIALALVLAGEVTAAPKIAMRASCDVAVTVFELALARVSAEPLRRAAPRRMLETQGQIQLGLAKVLFGLGRIDEAITARQNGQASMRAAAELPKSDPSPADSHGCASATPCSTLSDGAQWGLAEADAALVQAVADHGDQDWAAVATAVGKPAHHGLSLRDRWRELRGKVADKVGDGNKEMPCGHSCNACPTRASCHLHDALADIEDMFVA